MVKVEVMEELVGPQDHPHIVKGKRTKRQRPQSPIPFTITTQYSSSGEGGCVSNGDGINNHTHNLDSDNNSSFSSSEEDAPDHGTTEEDKYTAKCLILLAQGLVVKELSNKYSQGQDFGTEKFNSKRYIEAPISGNGKAGMYVYECKTCGRTFPSFQALGGHRASHKKPKNMAAEEKKMFLDTSDDEDETIFKNSKNEINNNSSSLSLEIIGNSTRGMSRPSSNCNNNNPCKSASFPKIHECCHCGAEFASGQALGGHMRRHRGAPAITNTTLSLGQLSPETTDQDSDEAEVKRTRSGLSLDLNLPAPEDDHQKDSKFNLASKQQQKHQGEEQPVLALSTAPKLVDCHY